MQNVLKQFGAKDTDSFERRFKFAIYKLTAVYIVIVAVFLFISSSITYSAFSNRLDRRFSSFHGVIINGMEIIRENRVPTPEEVRADLIDSLIVVNGILLIVAGALSYLLARINLDPIKQAYDRQHRFLGDVSHELRTPLSILKTDLENQLAIDSGNTKLAEKIKSNLEEVDRMSQMVNDLLFLSRSDENGHTLLSKSDVNLNQLLEQTIARLKNDADEHQVKINFERAGEVSVTTDPTILSQILTNLIKNAIVYNKPEGIVDIQAKTLGSQVQVIIPDTGVGIPKNHLSKIFDRFYRVEESRSRSTGGSGLGLSIVQSAIKRLHGRVDITSEAGKGTTVIVHLPVK